MKQQVDRIAATVSYDVESFHARIQFCPSCGTNNLQRCERELDPFGKRIQGREFWCSLCGFGFNVRASVEWNLALRLFKEHRMMRNNHRFIEKEFDPAIIQEWKKVYDKPKAALTWPVRSVYSLAEKLKAALS